jgi:hypothetical protein
VCLVRSENRNETKVAGAQEGKGEGQKKKPYLTWGFAHRCVNLGCNFKRNEKPLEVSTMGMIDLSYI